MSKTISKNLDVSSTHTELVLHPFSKQGKFLSEERSVQMDPEEKLEVEEVSKGNLILPNINLGKHRKKNTAFVFPKLGGMGNSSYSNSSHFMSMYQNRQSLETELGGNPWNEKKDAIEKNSFKSLEVGRTDNTKLNYYSNFRRKETMETTNLKVI